MGIYAHRFYFEKELPEIKEVKKKFFEITGLRLRYYSLAYPDELLTESGHLLHQLNKTATAWFNASIDSPQFACEEFENVHLGEGMAPESKSFYLEYGIGSPNLYFYKALIKTMLELGGQTFKYSFYPHEPDLEIEKYLKPYFPHERKWKCIKKWNEMSDLEKISFKCKHAK